MVEDREAMVGDMVHMIVGGKCFAALVVATTQDTVTLRRFVPFSITYSEDTMAEPYVSLKSARPTTGWHWMDEHVG